ncbi:hypothetical protein [Streptomyces sp. NPDC005407]|uniref:hypothetical protein n=1 Tax=Streptomyces sp. NPDC005407 TaxID=3155340 RepID=UPI0033BD9ED9
MLGRETRPLPDDLLDEERALCEELRRLQHLMDLSMQQLSVGTPVTDSTWCRYVNGQTFPTKAVLESLRDASTSSDKRKKLCAEHGLDFTHLLRLWDQADAARLRRKIAGSIPEDSEAERSSAPSPATDNHSSAKATVQESADARNTRPAPGTHAPDNVSPNQALPMPAASAAVTLRRRRSVTLAALALALAGGWYQLSGPSGAPTDDHIPPRRGERSNDPQPSSAATTEDKGPPPWAERTPSTSSTSSAATTEHKSPPPKAEWAPSPEAAESDPAGTPPPSSTTSYYTSRPPVVVGGNLIWKDTTIQVGGQLKSSDGCAKVVYDVRTSTAAVVDSQTRSVCGDTLGHGFTLNAGTAGSNAADHVWVDLYVDGTYASSDYCTRIACTTAHRG